MFEKFMEKFAKKEAEKNDMEFKPFDQAPRAEITAPQIIEEEAPVQKPETRSSGVELKVIRPESYEEVRTVADNLIAGCTVVLNLELLDPASTIRMLDFLNGVTYSTDGEIKNVSKSTYILTPNNVDVSDH